MPYYANSNTLHSVINHVFMPPRLPQMYSGKRKERKMNIALCNILIETAQDFAQFVPRSESALWMHMIKMLDFARRAAKVSLSEADLHRSLSDMVVGGTSTYFPYCSSLCSNVLP